MGWKFCEPSPPALWPPSSSGGDQKGCNGELFFFKALETRVAIACSTWYHHFLTSDEPDRHTHTAGADTDSVGNSPGQAQIGQVRALFVCAVSGTVST